MKQYFVTNDGKMVNLTEVTNIAFDPYFTDRFGNATPKIIFNFSYGVHLPKSDKVISDYVYSVYHNKADYDKAVKHLNQLINKKNWIAPVVDGEINKIINPDKVSFINFDDSNLRLIFNLTSSVSFHRNYHRLTSDFVYIDCVSPDEYQRNKDYVKAHLALVKM